MFLTKTFSLYSGSPNKLKVPILTPTGVAAININGTTINSGLSITPSVDLVYHFMLMDILCQNFQILNEEDSEIYILGYYWVY